MSLSYSDIDIKAILEEDKQKIAEAASKMPQPDPYLVKFGNIPREQIIKEYSASNKCSDALARAVVDLHLPLYREVY